MEPADAVWRPATAARGNEHTPSGPPSPPGALYTQTGAVLWENIFGGGGANAPQAEALRHRVRWGMGRGVPSPAD